MPSTSPKRRPSQRKGRRYPRPLGQADMVFKGVPYSINLAHCRLALVQCVVNREFAGMADLGRSIGASRSTVCRFFAGKQVSLTFLLKLLDALHLKFDDVATLVKNAAA